MQLHFKFIMTYNKALMNNKELLLFSMPAIRGEDF